MLTFSLGTIVYKVFNNKEGTKTPQAKKINLV